MFNHLFSKERERLRQVSCRNIEEYEIRMIILNTAQQEQVLVLGLIILHAKIDDLNRINSVNDNPRSIGDARSIIDTRSIKDTLSTLSIKIFVHFSLQDFLKSLFL